MDEIPVSVVKFLLVWRSQAYKKVRLGDERAGYARLASSVPTTFQTGNFGNPLGTGIQPKLTEPLRRQ